MKIHRLENTVKDIVQSIDKGDVIAVYSEYTPVSFEMDNLKSIEDKNLFSIGLRLFNNGRVGNSYINSLDDKDILIKKALESAELGDEMDIQMPVMKDHPDLKLFYPEVKEFEKEKAIEMGLKAVKRMKKIDSRAKINVAISKSYTMSFLANTRGFWGSYEESMFHFSLSMMLVEDNGSILEVGDGDSSNSLDLDLERVFNNVEKRYRDALKPASIDSGYYPVIIAPEALDILLGSIEIAANGKSLYKGISVLSDKIDKKIADEKFSIIDDPFYPGAIGNYPYDDEGVAPNKLPIIENGVFSNYIYDLNIGKKMGKNSTGHGSRGIATLPSPSFSNWILSTGSASLEDMIASVDKGLIIYETLGGGMSNIIAGDFSINVELGYLIEKGKIKGRVKDIMIAGNVYELIKSIKAIENKLNKTGTLYAPHILLERMSIAG